MADLKSKTKERLLDGMIKCVKGTTPWKVLIVDTQSMRIISAACRMHDILDLGVSLVEKIEAKREALPKMDAIYFLAPVEDSVNLLIADFENPKRPQYAAAHLFFTSRIPDLLLAKIKSKMVVSKIKTLKELNLEYLAYEKRFFNLEIPNSFWNHYSPDSKDLKSEQMKMAEKIVSIFVTLEDNPIVRYSASTPNTQQLASLVREKLDAFGQNVPEFSDTNEENHQSVLLILERAQDIITPLIHEFTYQAMVYDLLPIQNDHYKYMTTTNISSNKEKEVILGETDPLWVDLRHIHIADAMNRILDGFNEFVKQNKAAQVVSGVLKDVKEAQTKVDNLKEMSAAIKAMPQYQEMLDKYSLHINMATTVMKEYENRHLNKLAALEQEISTGEDSDGKPVKNLLSKLPLILQDETVRPSDKLKLLMLYTISEQGLKDGDRVRLLQHAKLSNLEQNILYNLKYLGVNIVKTKNEKRRSSVSGKKSRSDAPSYELSRYIPSIKKIGEDFLTGTLSQSEFPTMNSLMSSPPPRSGPKFASSLRKAAPKWSNNAKKETIEMENTRRNGRFILFVAGGVTFSEMRCIYELASQYNREVILGSTSIILPDSFVEQVASLKKDQLVEV